MGKKNKVALGIWFWGIATIVIGAIVGLIMGGINPVSKIDTSSYSSYSSSYSSSSSIKYKDTYNFNEACIWIGISLSAGVLLIGFSEVIELLQGCKDRLGGEEDTADSKADSDLPTPVVKPTEKIVKSYDFAAGEYTVGKDLNAGNYDVVGTGKVTIEADGKTDKYELFALGATRIALSSGAIVKNTQQAKFSLIEKITD